jgi:uncharacterized repeat protein (TIGR01451 family)
MPVPRVVRFTLLALLLAVLVPSVASAATFTKRFSQNDSGDIAIIGNTLLTCPTGQTNAQGISCPTAKDATSGNAGLADNDFDMTYFNTDGTTPGVFDSSAAKLNLPAGATVLFAGLYWGARTDAAGSGQAAPNPGAKDTVMLKAPGGSSYTTYTADAGWTIGGNDTAYQHFKNVTAAVRDAGSGSYTVANVQAGTGPDRYAGWSLVVAYEDLNAAPHNLSVFDGLTVVSQDAATANIDVSGFTTAPSGSVKTTLGAIAYEGDMGKTGDGMALEGHAISDAANPVNDLFNSSVSVLGTRVTADRNPSQRNNLGFDADLFNADGLLGNSATSARLTVNTAPTNGETIFSGVVTFSSELLAAKLRPTTTVTDLNGGNPEPGDLIDVATDAENTGNGAATATRIESDIPQGMEVVPGSLQVVDDGGNPVGPADAVSYDPDTRAITWNVGTSATSGAGGGIAVNGRVHVRYRLRIAAPADHAALPIGTVISYGTEGTSDHYDVEGTGGGSLTASSPDLGMTMTRSGDVVRGGRLDYTLKVRNTGSATARGLTRVTDQLPASLAADSTPSGQGWDCSVVSGLVTCDTTDGLASSASFPDIVVPVRVAQGASGAIANTATVTNAGDGNPANNSATDTTSGAPTARAGVSLALSRDLATIAPGAIATITATVTNGGPSDATGVQVSLPLPGGVTLVSAQTGGVDCVATLCTIPSIAAGGATTATYVVRARRTAAGTSQGFTATETAAVADATANDDSAAVQVDVAEERDVSITQTVSPDPLVAGDAATIHLGVRNDGPSTATGVVLTEPLPMQLHGVTVDIDPSAGTCAVTAGTLRCDLAPLPDGASAAITVHATVATSAAHAELDLTASIAAVPADVDATDDGVTVHRTVAGEADLSLTSVDAPATLRAGTRGTWVFRAANGGHGDATGTVLRFPLPGGLRVADASGAACATIAGVVSCTIGDIAAGAHTDVTLTLAAAATAPAGPFTLAAVLSGEEPDPDSADAAVDVPGTLVREADLAVTQTGPAEVVAGRPASYVTTVGNGGPADATDVVVTLTVPAGLNGPSAVVRGGGGTCAATAASTITCRIAVLPAGARAAIDLTGTFASNAGGAAVSAVARVRSAEQEADPSDNEASNGATAVAVSDVSVSAVAPGGTIAAGTRTQVTLSVRNGGPSDTSDVVLTATLPSAAQPVDLDARCAVAGRTVTCHLGGMTVGEVRPMVIKVRAERAFDGAALGAGASVDAAGRDPEPANDSLAAVADEPIRCTSRRKFTIHLRVPPSAKLKGVSVKVAGKPVRVRVGRRLTAVVDLRTRPAGRIVVSIHAVTRGGKDIVGTRAYQTCTVKRPAHKAPRV